MKIGKGFWAIIGIQIVLLGVIIVLLYKQNTQKDYVPVPGPQGSQGLEGRGYIPIKGVDYFDGKDGLQGERGARGSRGAVGPQGVQGLRGFTGATGLQGSQGEQGVQGEQGPPGREQETRCVELDDGRVRHDKRYSDDPSWQVDFYLPVGSSCDG
jgi:hypothetical protein